MNMLEKLEQICEPEFPPELIALRSKWEKADGGWTQETRKEVEDAFKQNPEVGYWQKFLAGLDWTIDTPNKLDKLYDLLAQDGLISQEIAEASKKHKTQLSPAAQVLEGKGLSQWLRETREFKQRQQWWEQAA